MKINPDLTNNDKSFTRSAFSIRNVPKCPNGNAIDRNSSITNEEDISSSANVRRSSMYTIFQNWAIQNYGDRGKTKTVTRNKYKRIVRILTGDEEFTAENSKFRFWVKAKGFQLSSEDGKFGANVLVVPSRIGDVGQTEATFKQVAVVESFFDIIYNVHVEMDGRGGKHAGQKRTYRAISETYSFLPREAVTRFLMSCTDCQKRMHLSVECNNNLSLTEDRSDATQEDSVLSEPTQDADNVTESTIHDLSDSSKETPSYDFSESAKETPLYDLSDSSKETPPYDTSDNNVNAFNSLNVTL